MRRARKERKEMLDKARILRHLHAFCFLLELTLHFGMWRSSSYLKAMMEMAR